MLRTRRSISLISVILLAVAAAAIGVVQAATPSAPVKANPIPKLTLSWLGALTVSPSSVAAGTDITGTVSLLRPAVENVQVGLSLEGAAPDESGIQVAAGAIAPMSVLVPAKSDHATFHINTFTGNNVTLPKTFTLTAHYGDEAKTASFTVNSLPRKTKLP